MEKEIKAAVDWWGEAIKSPKFDNGDKSDTGAMTTIMMTLASGDRPSDEQIQEFKQEYAKLLKFSFAGCWYLDDPSRGAGLRCQGVDYHPHGEMLQAAEKAGISPKRFPIKTNMWVDPGRVTVSYGYGAPLKVIYETPA